MQISALGGAGFVLKDATMSVLLAGDAAQAHDAEIIIAPTGDGKLKTNNERVVFDWPGEYEARGVSVMIIPVGKTPKSNVIKILFEDISIAHLDNIAEPLTEAEEEKVGNVDVLFISIGKNSKLDEKQIKNTIEEISPRLVIPMNFADGEENVFAKEFGFGEIEAENVLKLKRSDLPSDRMDLKILRPRK